MKSQSRNAARILALLALALVALPVRAHEGSHADKPGRAAKATKAKAAKTSTTATGAAPAEMSAEEKAAMEAWSKAATPNENHAALEPLVGTFEATVTMWTAPDAPPTTSPGKSVNTWVLGGRYLQQTHRGEFMGEPFEGIGFTGYDNVQKKYVGTWMDNMGTGIMTSHGMRSSPTELTMLASCWDPASGTEKQFKEKITIADRNHHVFEMWGAGPTGDVMKMMEISYVRVAEVAPARSTGQ